MHWAVHTVETRCNEVGLSVKLDKTKLVFSRKSNLLGIIGTHLFGVATQSYIGQVPRGSPGFSADLEGACVCPGDEGPQSFVGLQRA